MAVNFKIPSSPKKLVYESSNFLGADFTSEASTVDDTKSPNVENMIRSVPGKIRKRMGYKLFADYGETIYGVHHLSTTDVWLIHAGNKLYNLTAPKGSKWIDHVNNFIVDHEAEPNNILFQTGDVSITLIYTGMARHRSVSFQLNQKLIILDGTKLRVYDGSTVQPVENIAYIPTLSIAKDYTGGGTDYEPLNLLQPGFIEQFYVKEDQASVTTFQLTFGNLDATTVKAWLLNSSGAWIEKTEGTHFTVNRSTGVVTFTSAPGPSPIAGEDNVKIQAYRTVAGYADRINHCTIGAMFGVNGAGDRLFVSGNPDQGYDGDGNLFTYINCDWFSQQYDPTYFADTWYSKLGSDTSAIMGYSIINNYLAAHKDYNELSQSILIREGDLVDDEPVFKLINTLQGAGAISRYCFSYLATEPVFLTRLGIFAVTAQDITGEKYAQDRSYYLEGKLLKEDHLENAIAFTWKDYYLLGINDHVYILDGLQPIRTDRSRPYATRQYVGYYFTNVPATVFFEINGELFFGSTDGKVFKWYTDDKALESYNDNGEAINAVWETADISEKLFYKKKTYRYLAIRCMPEIASSIQVWAQKQGQWVELKDDTSTLKYFSFENFIYSKMTYSCNKTQRISATKIRLKKLDHVRFKFVNDDLNEPLGINDFAVEYTQAGNVK
ncbi:hypothetical protein [Butyrivibrio sp. AE2032]|uniref:hypothetical protein n=1 Tax=Butyrivibrio sp. AE2032 TaxID=1458463 RepID=UPI00054F627F|nr:hypothetical protein [Butyrivibrio sp. AE2032]